MWKIFFVGLLFLGEMPTWPQTTGSQFSNQEWPLRNPYQVQPRFQTGDVIRVVIDENMLADYEFELKRDDSVTIRFIPDKGLTPFLPGSDSNKTVARNQKGKSRGNSRIQHTMSVLVQAVNQDGTLQLNGIKVLTYDGESSSIQLRGLAHPRDVGMDNTLFSARIANLALSFQGKIVKKNFPVAASTQPNQNANTNQNRPVDAGSTNQSTQQTTQFSDAQKENIRRRYLGEVLGELLDQNEQRGQ